MLLPIADKKQLLRYLRSLARRYRAKLALVAGLQALASLVALVTPWVLGQMVQEIGTGLSVGRLNVYIATLVGAVVLAAVVAYFATRAAFIVGEEVFAAVREKFIETVVHLPLSVVERAGTGDLLGRSTNDIDRIQWAVRFGIPRALVIVITIVVTTVAAIFVNPLVALALITGVPLFIFAARAYLRKAIPAFLKAASAWADINGVLTEQVEGARTIDALNLGAKRRDRLDETVRESFHWEKVGMWLRVKLFPSVNLAVVIPLVVVIMWGTWLEGRGLASVAAITTIALYTMQLRDPATEAMFWIDVMQSAQASFARLVGIDEVPPDRHVSGETPRNASIVASGVRYAYRDGQDVLHGIDLVLHPGERLAIVGPSGAGKSTFGRMLAGIHPPSAGSVTVGGVRLVDLDEEELRRQVALVTQEHHVFVGTLAENLRLAHKEASDEELWQALDVVDATWARGLAHGLATEVGSGGLTLTPAQSQQLALARLVLLDPHTLVLDEATSLLDPRAARHLEQSLSAVLAGRTVVAIAHRLQTAHDADRVAVIQHGRISEIGSHDELVAANGEYAALWRSWHS